MSCIHFKFKNRQEYEKVPISGLEISGKELKEAILKKKKIGHSNLQIADAQSKKGEGRSRAGWKEQSLVYEDNYVCCV